jgi:H+/gluconate symporter-like permease
MKKLLAIAVVTVVLAVLTFSNATAASGPTLAQFRRLQRQVNRVEALANRLNNCTSTIGVSQFNDYASVNGGGVTGLDIDATTADWYVVVWNC